MSESAVGRTSEFIAESATQPSRATGAIAEAIQDGIGVVRRAAQQGGDAAEEILTDTTQRIQRHPVLTGHDVRSRFCSRNLDRMGNETKVDQRLVF